MPIMSNKEKGDNKVVNCIALHKTGCFHKEILKFFTSSAENTYLNNAVISTMHPMKRMPQ